MKNVVNVCLVLSLVVEISFSAVHYIRQGASGVGTDWINAYGKLPSNLIRGDTYYIADGTYPGMYLDDFDPKGKYITIKKAIESDHGSNTGWKTEYGNGSAEFGATTFRRGHYILDGQVGGGTGQWDKNFGFKFKSNGGTVLMYHGSTRSSDPYRVIRNISIKHFDATSGMTNPGGGIGTKLVKGFNWSWSHGYIHDLKGVQFGLQYPVDGFMIENCLVARNSSWTWPNGKGAHVEAFKGDQSRNGTFRYNIFEDIVGSGIIVIMNDNNKLYGNIFRWTRDFGTTINAGPIGSLSAQSSTLKNTHVYNNSFISIRCKLFSTGNGGNLFFRNNLFYNCWDVSVAGTHDNNTYINCKYAWSFSLGAQENQLTGSDPFVNIAGNEFELKSPTAKGATLSDPYNLDWNGFNRGADGNWDRGAFEYDPGQVTNIKMESLFSSESNYSSSSIFPNPLHINDHLSNLLINNNYRLIQITGTGKEISNGIYLIISDNNQMVQKVTVVSK